VKALRQRVEAQALGGLDDELSVEEEVGTGKGRDQGLDLREVAAERLARAGPERDLSPSAKGKAAKAVPLGLEPPLIACGKLLHQQRLHRGGRGGHARVIQTGAWSLVLGRPRTLRSTPAASRRLAATGFRRWWSMRRPASR
jgi:hypothetical protein